MAEQPERVAMRVQCLQGGSVPCVDDLCHGVDTTLCGLERGYDFCDHGCWPDACPECEAEAEIDDWEAGDGG